MWEVTAVAAGAPVQDLLWDSAAWGVSRGRKPASRCKGGHGYVRIARVCERV